MKLIYVGTLSKTPDRDTSWIQAFSSLGNEVIPFSSYHAVCSNKIIGKIQRRLGIGKGNRQMQDELLSLVSKNLPNWIHFRMPIEFDRLYLEKLKHSNLVLTQYFNDDPFSPKRVPWLFNKFKKSISLYDGNFVFRAHNIKSYQLMGASHVEHCPPSYDPNVHYMSSIRDIQSSYIADAAFIGHWENDWRVNCLNALVTNGYSVIVKGGMWDKPIKGLEIGRLAPISHSFGDEYNFIYANVTAGLCFFSKINNDSWTRRALEIIAVGGVLVCERTIEAESYFQDRKEAFFFSSIEELINIVKILKYDPINREKVRLAGYERLLRGDHTIKSRAKQIFNFVENKIKDTNGN